MYLQKKVVVYNRCIRVLFIRHAESENNNLQVQFEGKQPEKYKDQRLSNPSISEKGQVQVEALCRYLKKKGISPKKVFCSCFKRACQTADIIQNHFGAPVEIFADLGELGKQYLKDKPEKGENKAWFEKNFPKFILCDPKLNNEGWNHSDHIEREEEVAQRAKQVIDRIQSICQEYEKVEPNLNLDLIFVTHGLFLNEILWYLMAKQSSKHNRSYTHLNTAITEFNYVNGNFYLAYFNDTNHLESWSHADDPEMMQQINKFKGLKTNFYEEKIL